VKMALPPSSARAAVSVFSRASGQSSRSSSTQDAAAARASHLPSGSPSGARLPSASPKSSGSYSRWLSRSTPGLGIARQFYGECDGIKSP
jgi:hypothetical protein